MKASLSLTLLLVILWAGLSGHFSLEWLIFTLGVVSIAFVAAFQVRLLRAASANPIHDQMVGTLFRAPRFLWFLTVKIVFANLRVTRLLLDPKTDIDPRVLRIRTGVQSNMGRFLLANSITLTPGTITLDVRDDEVLYAQASRVLHQEANPHNGRALIQRHGDREVWINPPPVPLSTAEMDAVFELPYRRRPHPQPGPMLPKRR